MSEDILFTVAETAEYLKVSKVTVYKMIKNRELEAINIGKRGIRIPKVLMEKYVNKCKGIPYEDSIFSIATSKIYRRLILL